MSYGKKFTLIILAVISNSLYAGAWGWNMPRGVTPISHEIYHLHMVIFYICVVIGVLVFSVMFYAMIKHRKSKGAVPANFHDHLGVEIAWTIIPALILVAMAIPATNVLMAMNNTEKAEVNIKVTGYQWYWRYDYLDDNVKFYSRLSTPQEQIHNQRPKGKWYLLEVDEPLVLPIHKKIRFMMTANDVNHSWWVPELGIKKDALPGMINSAWAIIEQPGVYRGKCTELCGMQHGYMPIVVVALNNHDYNEWLYAKKTGVRIAPEMLEEAVSLELKGTKEALHLHNATKVKEAQKPVKLSKDTLMTEGKSVYNKICSACHQASGKGMPPAFPAIIGSKIATGPLAQHIDIILNGSKKNQAMQAFRDQLTDREIAAVITYQRNAFGNDNKKKYGKYAGGIIQPEIITKARDN